MDSRIVKQLRILTGRHAGTRLRLTHPHYTIGAGDDTDVQILDWKHQTVTLSIEEGSNVIRLALAGSAQGAAPEATALEDFAPRCFGDVVLCAGPANDKAWPSDVQLLKRMLEPRKPAVAASGRPSYRLLTLGGAASALMLAGFTSVVVNHTREAQAREQPLPLSREVTIALQRAGFVDLQVVGKDDTHVTVSGLVPGQAELQRVQAIAQTFPGGAVLARVSIANDISRAISDALQSSSVRVDYRGDGVFVVDGEAPDLQVLRASVDRIAHDIGPAVKRIDVAVKAAPAAEQAHLDAMLVTRDIQYVQTRDGTKHLVVTSPAGASGPDLD
jgi:type III secretion protein D